MEPYFHSSTCICLVVCTATTLPLPVLRIISRVEDNINVDTKAWRFEDMNGNELARLIAWFPLFGMVRSLVTPHEYYPLVRSVLCCKPVAP